MLGYFSVLSLPRYKARSRRSVYLFIYPSDIYSSIYHSTYSYMIVCKFLPRTTSTRFSTIFPYWVGIHKFFSLKIVLWRPNISIVFVAYITLEKYGIIQLTISAFIEKKIKQFLVFIQNRWIRTSSHPYEKICLALYYIQFSTKKNVQSKY